MSVQLTFLGNILHQHLAQPPCVEDLYALRGHSLQGGGQRRPWKWVLRPQGFCPIEEELPGGWEGNLRVRLGPRGRSLLPGF